MNNAQPMIEDAAPQEVRDMPANRSMHRLHIVAPIMTMCAGIMFFSMTSPRSVPSVLLIAGFLVLGAMLFSVLYIVLSLGGIASRLPRAYRRSIMWVGSIMPVLLLMMQSLGRLTVRDVAALAGLVAIGAFYVARAGRR